MSVKVIVQRKIRPGKENEFAKALRELRSKAVHAHGYISGESLCAIADPSLHVVISTWSSLEDWNRWATSAERKAFQQKTDEMLEAPAIVTAYQHELTASSTDKILAALESTIQDQ